MYNLFLFLFRCFYDDCFFRSRVSTVSAFQIKLCEGVEGADCSSFIVAHT